MVHKAQICLTGSINRDNISLVYKKNKNFFKGQIFTYFQWVSKQALNKETLSIKKWKINNKFQLSTKHFKRKVNTRINIFRIK